MPAYRIRRATPADLGTLVVHRRRMWEEIGGYSRRELDAADPVYRRWARSRLRSGSLVGFVAERGGDPVASGCVWVQPVQPRPRWPRGIRPRPTGRGLSRGALPPSAGPSRATQPYLLSMFTEPDHRGRGLAARIVKEAIAWARKNGYPRLSLHASDMGKGVYHKLGFRATREMVLKL